jgi:hypothetical protein
MPDRHPPNPDAAQLPPDEVRDAFVSGLENWDEDEERADRIVERAALVLADRPVAADAQGFAVALVAWGAGDVLPALDARAIDLPRVSSWDDLGELRRELAPLVARMDDAWSQAYRAAPHEDDRAHDEYAAYSAFQHIERAVDALCRIPRYRLTDPNWKARRPRPTPLSLCVEAAQQISWCFSYALDVAPDAEGALDRLGLAPADVDAAERVARARRALGAVGFSKPGARLVKFADILAGIVAVSPNVEPREMAERALDATPDSAARIAGEDPALATRPLAQPAASVSEAARAALVEVGAEVAHSLAAATPTRSARALPPSQPTPVSAAALPSPADLAARLIRSVEQNRRKPPAALAELRKLALSDEETQRVLDTIIAAALREGGSFSEALDHARLAIGAIDGLLLLAVRAHGRSGTHLWLSDPEVAVDDARFAQTLCGSSLGSGRIEILRGRPRRSVDGRNVVGSYRHFGHGAGDLCDRCRQRADDAGLLPDAEDATPAAEAPPQLRERLRHAALAADPDASDWRPESLSSKLSSEIDELTREQAVADALRVGEACASRILGPARYRRERSSFTDAQVTRALLAEDWAQIATTEERSRGRVLLDLAKERQAAEGYRGRGGAPSWDTFFEALCAFHAEHGHTRVPRGFQTSNGLKLGFWLRNQRAAWKGAPGRRMSVEQFKRLSELDPDWISGQPPRAQPAPRVPAPPAASGGRAHLRLVGGAGAAGPAPRTAPTPITPPSGSPKVMVWKGSREARDSCFKTHAVRDGEHIVFVGSDRFGRELRLDLISLGAAVETGQATVACIWVAGDNESAAERQLRVETHDVEVRFFDGDRQLLTMRVGELRKALARVAARS